MGQNIKIGPMYDVLVTRQHGRYRTEVMIYSLAKDGSTSQVVISRSADGYVRELSMGCTQPTYADCSAVNSGKPDAYITQREQSKPVYNNTDDRDIPTVNRRCQHVPGEDRVSLGCPAISMRMTFLLPNAVNLPEQHGRIHWETAIQNVQGVPEQNVSWNFEERKNCLINGTDNIRCESCLDQNNRIRYMWSVQGHSRGVQKGPTLQNNV